MSLLPICDFRLEIRCGVCYECKLKETQSANKVLETKLADSKEKLKIAVDTLEFYADVGNWSYSQILDDISSVKGSLESGKTARNTLEKIKGM